MYAVYAVLGAVLGVGMWWLTRRKDKRSFLTPGAPKDTVIFHQYGPAPFVPSISPFVMKLETFLRVAKIPYVNKFDRQPGPKGKLPWIQYNDKVIPDSQIIIEFLEKEFKVTLNVNLTDEQKATGHMIRKVAEEWLYWILVTWRLAFEVKGTIYRMLGLPSIIIWYMRRTVRPRLYSQGIGRHSQQEVTEMMRQDLDAFDALLGSKKYLFGNSSHDVTEYDCALFGQLCQLAWQMPDTGVEEMMRERYPRLVAYCVNMREEFWPDWDKRLKTSASKLQSSAEVQTSDGPHSHSQPENDQTVPGPFIRKRLETSVKGAI